MNNKNNLRVIINIWKSFRFQIVEKLEIWETPILKDLWDFDENQIKAFQFQISFPTNFSINLLPCMKLRLETKPKDHKTFLWFWTEIEY